MINSILTSIKKMLGITEEYDAFDDDIIMHINSVFLTLKQMGVGPSTGFRIDDAGETWENYIPTEDNPDNIELLSAVKTYIHLKVKMLFDPPASAAITSSYEKQIAELEWRLNLEAESE